MECPRKAEDAYKNPKDKFKRVIKIRTDRCVGERRPGGTGCYSCRDCGINVRYERAWKKAE